MYGGHQPSNNSRGNLPPNGMHLSYNAPPFIPNSIQLSSVQIPTHVNPWHSYAEMGNACSLPYVHLCLKDSARIWWNGQKADNGLVEFLSTDLPTTYKGLMEKTYTWIEAKEVATNGVPNDHRDSFDRPISNLSTSPREILATEKLKHHIEEAVKSGQLTHLLKGIKKGKAKASDAQLSEWNKGDKDTTLVNAPILMINKETYASIRSLRVNSKVPLVDFSGEHSWPLEEVPLEIIIREGPFTRTEVLNFVIVRFNSLHNLLLGRTAMQKIVNQKVESLLRFRLKCFLDVYKGYHQIQMAEGDEDNTTFFTGKGVFCYTKMPFRLKNARATYQRLIDKVFNNQIGRNLEAYVDDMLNPKKCCFGIEEGPFLGHLITKKGIKPDPLKFKVISNLPSPKTLKEIQILNGKLAYLSRFLSKGEALIMYLATSMESISAILLAERGKRQVRIYFVLAGFLSKMPSVEGKDTKTKRCETPNKESNLEDTWKLYTDRASSSDGSGAGLMLVSPEGKEYTYALRFEFETTNNEAEYEALLAGLQIAVDMKVKDLSIFVDS
ncbi:reverse transcriptase domain-containing protein [Tanacetum coccineum]|uniref:Reverse transcriptase domain-containing protein n=1 Tax=Tanacetum coccineum TaxID=301880 RepID=A0ABQ5GKP7_9ASTR